MKKANPEVKGTGLASASLSTGIQESKLIIPQTNLFVSALVQENHLERGLFVSVLIDSPYAFDPSQIRLPITKTEKPITEATKALTHALSRMSSGHPVKVFYSLPVEPRFDVLDTSGFTSVEFEAVLPADNISYPALRDFIRKQGIY